jgi:hypothetical protein
MDKRILKNGCACNSRDVDATMDGRAADKILRAGAGTERLCGYADDMTGWADDGSGTADGCGAADAEPYSGLCGYTMIPDPEQGGIANLSES